MIALPPPPPAWFQEPPAPPKFSLPARGRTTIKFKVDCAAECAVVATFNVDRPTAKALGLGRKLTAGSLETTVGPGKAPLTLRLVKKAKKALLAGPKEKSYLGRLKVTATYAGAAPVSASRQVRLRR